MPPYQLFRSFKMAICSSPHILVVIHFPKYSELIDRHVTHYKLVFYFHKNKYCLLGIVSFLKKYT